MAECNLTERIKFEVLEAGTTNENGFTEEQWTTYYPCWAKKEELSGKEYIKLHGEHTEILVGFTVRMCEKIKKVVAEYETKRYRVIYRDRVYDIQYGHDVKNKHNFADFKCKLVK